MYFRFFLVWQWFSCESEKIKILRYVNWYILDTTNSIAIDYIYVAMLLFLIAAQVIPTVTLDSETVSLYCNCGYVL